MIKDLIIKILWSRRERQKSKRSKNKNINIVVINHDYKMTCIQISLLSGL